MSAIVEWFRLDLRQRWRSLLVLALLAALASGTVMTAVEGARRGDSALDRLLSETLPATIVALPNQPGFDWSPIRELPEVEALSGFAVSIFEVDGIQSEDYATGFPQADAEVWQSIERPVMLEGRVLDPTREDEVMASPSFMARYGYQVGDTVTLHLYTPEQIDLEAGGGSAEGKPGGPTVDATIVGVPRSYWFADRVGDGDDTGALYPSPALFMNHEANFLGTDNANGFVNALIRLRGGTDDIAPFKDDLARITGRDDIDVWDMSLAQAHSREVAGFEATSLLVFALAASIAAVFLVGQAVVRHVAATLNDLEPLRAVGMTPSETRRAVALGPTLAAIAGWLIGAATAVVASRWFPIGTAAPFEPSPGFHVDVLVLAGGFVVLLVLVSGGALLVTSVAMRAGAGNVAARRSTVAATAVRAGMPVPVVVGARFALEPGKGRTAVPVRPALFGAAVGVLGVLAAITFSGGINDAVSNQQRFGLTYELGSFLGGNGFDYVPADQVFGAIATDPDVAAVNNARMEVAQVNDVAVSVYTLDPVDRPIDLVFTDGRPPSGTNEIAFGPRSADEAGVDVGDTVAVTGTTGTRELTVSGIGFVPPGPHNDYASGGWVTAEAYDTLFEGFKFHFGLIALNAGADPTAVADRLGEAGIGVYPADPPTEVAELLQVRSIPIFLAGFLLIMALGAIGHALSTAVRRRSHDVAVLRALGMSRRQSRLIVVTQATLLALVGLVVGVPLGIAAGRTVWRYVAERTPLFYLPPKTLAILILLVPLAFLAVNLLAVGPSRHAARLRLAEVLRTE